MSRRKPGGNAAPPPSKPAAASTASGKRGAMSEGQQAYEARRAKEAGLSLETWLARKRVAPAPSDPTRKPTVPRRKGLLSRLLDRAHQPLK